LIFLAHLEWEYSLEDLHFVTATDLTLPTDRLHSLGGS